MVDSPGSNEYGIDFRLIDEYLPSQAGIAQQGDPGGEEHAGDQQTSSTVWDQQFDAGYDDGMTFIQSRNDIIHYEYPAGSELPALSTPPMHGPDMDVTHRMNVLNKSHNVYSGQQGSVREISPRAAQPRYPPPPLLQQTYDVVSQHSLHAPMETGNSSNVHHGKAAGTRKRQQTSTRKKVASASGINQQQSREAQLPAYSQQHATGKAGTSRARKPRRQPTVDPITGLEILVSTGHPKGCECVTCVYHRANNAKNSRNHAARQKHEIVRLTALLRRRDAQLAVEKAKNVKLESRLSFAAEKRLEKRITEMKKSLKEHMDAQIKDVVRTIMTAASADTTSTGKAVKGQAKRVKPSTTQARALSPTPQQDPMTCDANVNDFHAT
ncbi:hypothetical protein AAVH_41606 [Aphelenchoides avenae]|nr:hypothetical protein AAVH_41606 [Aphelenchus avenae]